VGKANPRSHQKKVVPVGLKPKDMVGIPWRVALALQADGWYLRSDIIWNKPNPMPESVRDRPTKSHEYIFLLTKSARYFFDQEAVREANTSMDDYNRRMVKIHKVTDSAYRKNEVGGERDRGDFYNPTGRNIRSVWTMTTKPYSEAHFATFPPELPERCIKAGTSLKGCCAKCGAPWERIVERSNPSAAFADDEVLGWANTHQKTSNPQSSKSLHRQKGGVYPTAKVTGWQPTCECGIEETAPCTVLDIFAGSGTTGMVAKNLGRKATLIELNPEYERLIRLRTGLGVKHGPMDNFNIEI